MNQDRFGPYGFASSEPDEMEALQSDVMRFMAILGLCLMIIFALVQSLPQNHKSNETAIEQSNPSANEDSVPIQEEREALKEERKAMYDELDSLQEQLVQLDHAIAEKKAANNQLAEEEEKLREKIIAHGQQLQNLERKIKIRERFIRPIPPKRPESKPAKKATQAITIAQLKEHPKVNNPVVQQESSSTEKEGFTLRFQSKTALDSLVRKGAVQLFVQIGKQFHVLQSTGTEQAFHSAPAPASFHEMEPHTVPASYKRMLVRSTIQVVHGQQRTWGVVLPTSIQSQINQSMANHKGGELQIDRRGQVSYH